MRSAALLFCSVAPLFTAGRVHAIEASGRDESIVRVADAVDRAIAASWPSDASPAPIADDATFLRRVWLDVVGDIPTPEHLVAFEFDRSSDKRRRVVQGLLGDEHYGLNWARYWRDVILARRLEPRAITAEPALVADLANWLNVNEGWDAVATRFITATGDVRENGAAALIFAQDGRTEEIAAEASRIFLGMQIQCAQCHDHPYDSWKREQFHELAAFFPRVAVRPVQSATRRSFSVFGSDRAGRGRGDEGRRPELEHHMPDLDDPQATGRQMQPRFFLTGATVSIGTSDEERRQVLSRYFSKNVWFANSVVNRMWMELVGAGFYEPVDDMGPERSSSAPEALEILAEGFAENQFELKWLVETICATEAYQRESRPRRESGVAPFLANVPQPLRADQLLNAVMSAVDLADLPGERRGVRRTGFRASFGEPFAFDPSEARCDVGSSLPQELYLMNSPELNRLIDGRRRSWLGALQREYEDPSELIREVYLRVLTRLPDSAEEAELLAYFAAEETTAESLQDLAWALLNSAEFRYRR
ncbi:MAG: DUF1549 domain-containing protein [Planctomycetales bacterium]|nr:DUF1549 domain-containing protein [Planctomycetales bacterium]